MASQNPLFRKALNLLSPIVRSEFAIPDDNVSASAEWSWSAKSTGRKWTAEVNGGTVSPTEGQDYEDNEMILSLQFGRNISPEPLSHFALVFDYFLSPVLRCTEIKLEAAGISQLAQITTPHPRDGEAVCLLPFKLDTAIDKLDLRLTLYVSADKPVSSVTDLILKNFQIFRLERFSISTKFYKAGANTFFAVNYGGTGLVSKNDIISVSQFSAGSYMVAMDLISLSNSTNQLHFESGTMTVYTSNDELSFVFPLPQNQNDNGDDWSIFKYIARLWFYGYRELKLLTFEEQLNLDTRLDLYSPSLSPMLKPQPKSVMGNSIFTATQALPQLETSGQKRLGGASAVNITPMLEFMNKQGQYVISAAATDLSDSSPFTPIKNKDIRELSVPFAGLDAFHVLKHYTHFSLGANGPVGAGERYNHLFFNPVQTDIDVSRMNALHYARSLAAFAQSEIVSDITLAIELKEIGDTWSAMPFLISAETASKVLEKRSFRLPGHWAPYVDDNSNLRPFLEIPKVQGGNTYPLKPSDSYRLGYWEFLCGETSDRLAKLSRFAETSSTEPLLADVWSSLQAVTAIYCTQPLPIVRTSSSGAISFSETTQEFAKIKPDFKNKFATVQPSNGPYDQAMYLSSDIDNREMSVRLESILSPFNPVAAANWYCQFRYWLKANLAYLCASADSARAALAGTKNYVHSNLNTFHGYWNFEIYNTLRSGALDCVFFHDQHIRETQVYSHLIFAGLMADFARAACSTPKLLRNPFAQPTTGLGALFSKERPDIKAMIWASRGARKFHVWSTSDYLVFSSDDNGYGNSGDLSYQLTAQMRAAMGVLARASKQIDGAKRVAAQIAMLVPQTETIWNLSDSDHQQEKDRKGFYHEFFTHGGEFSGVHAMFTHAQLPVDLVFEEAIADSVFWNSNPVAGVGQPIPSAPALDRYKVLWLNTRFLRDDVFLLIAQWVEKGGTLLLGNPVDWQARTNLQLPQEFKDSSVASFNEFAERRRAPPSSTGSSGQGQSFSRDAWLASGTTVNLSPNTQFKKIGDGAVIDLSDWPNLTGRKYSYLDIVAKQFKEGEDMVSPDSVPVALNQTNEFIALISSVLSQLNPPTTILKSTVEVKSNVSSDPCLVEVVDLRKMGPRFFTQLSPDLMGFRREVAFVPFLPSFKPISGVIFIINHRHRQFDADKIFSVSGQRERGTSANPDSFLDPATGEHVRLKQKVQVSIHDLRAGSYSATVHTGDGTVSKTFSVSGGNSGQFSMDLGDYAVITWGRVRSRRA